MASKRSPLNNAMSKTSLGRGRVTPPKKMARPKGLISKIHGAKAAPRGGKSHGRNY